MNNSDPRGTNSLQNIDCMLDAGIQSADRTFINRNNLPGFGYYSHFGI